MAKRYNKTRPIHEGLPRGQEKNERVVEHLTAKENGDPIPYFRDIDGRLKYFDKKKTNPDTGEISYGLVDLSTKLEREARRQADKINITPTLELFKEVFGPDIGSQVFISELQKSKALFADVDTDLYDLDHMGSRKFKYPHMARNLNPQLSAYNRSEGARELTDEQANALRVVRDDLKTSLALQGPEPTQQTKNQIMGRDDTGAPLAQLKAGGKPNITGLLPPEVQQGIGFAASLKARNPVGMILNSPGPVGDATMEGKLPMDIAEHNYNVKNNTFNKVMNGIENGVNGASDIHRKVMMAPVNGIKNGANGIKNGVEELNGHATNEAEYIHSKLSNGEIPYTDWIKESMLKWM